ncbi:hypothetical protein BHE74_00014245 [Ensete ventricosum]|nr:hypothetical protein BHE74_00014245 [Ensete ventricosum]
MRWLCKFFKGTSTGVSNGRHPQVNGEGNLFHGPIKPVDDRSTAENEDLDRAIAISLDEDAKRPDGRFNYKLTRKCEVTAILVLYGLPRLLTGSILAHELMHGWLRLTVILLGYLFSLLGYQNLSPEVEEGICQVLAHMWLESEVMPGSTSMPSSSNYVPSSSSCSSSSTSSIPSSKKAGKSVIEKKLGEFFMHQIAQDTSPAYGEGFRAANAAVNKYGLRRTLEHIRLTKGNLPM